MAFDQSTRNFLQRTVTKCREILAGRWQAPTEGEFFRQLQEIHGISPDGVAAPMDVLAHLGDEDRETSCVLRDTIDHYTAGLKASGKSEKDARREAVMRVAREQAFTVLNRLAALRMAEERGIVLECVRKGTQSEGFQLFLQSAGSAFGSTSSAYRAYLHLLFDELARDLGVLFNRFDKGSLIFPRHEPLESLLKELNGTGEANRDASFAPEQVASLWGEDEAVGWIYQYYNDPSERKKMREESAAPRNSRELAVRNQFFTPRYVVEFLTDNTLGRIWYEMTQGDTTLKEQCRYLVRRPIEIFLQPNETAPEQLRQENLSQEDLIKQPVHIPHRPLKDPRTILMLDPACGSMHFGLYAFDLFEVIYDEAWALEERLGVNALSRPPEMKSLHDTYAGKDAFLKDVPRLIIENNIHGIDIDPRAAQIAGLSLWLRAQKAWQRLGLKPAERPAIKRSNIVCAEPMPGERELLREFVEREFPAAERAVCLRLLEAIFDKMQLAGEAGSLLKIEEEISSAIEEAEKQWKAGPKMEQSQLFGGEKLKQQNIPIDYTGLTEGEFWDQLEEKAYTALRDYAEQAEHGGGFQRRLFAEDAARGFAFIDVCRKRYDVALMNPPFGAASKLLQTRLEQLGFQGRDLAADFISNSLRLTAARGFVGAITTRTIFFLKGFLDWRNSLVKDYGGTRCFLDIGFGVLDAAVEACAFTVEASKASFMGQYFRGLGQNSQMESGGAESVARTPQFLMDANSFTRIPRQPFAYWCSPKLLSAFEQSAKVGDSFDVLSGGNPRDDFRFIRHWVEIPTKSPSDFVPYSKGGEFAFYYFDVHLMLKWADDGKELKVQAAEYRRQLGWSPDWRALMMNYDRYFTAGITWPRRTSRLSFRFLPRGCVFGDKSPVILSRSQDLEHLFPLVGYLNTSTFNEALNLMVGSSELAQSFEVGIVKSCPLPKANEERQGAIVRDVFRKLYGLDTVNEDSHAYVGVALHHKSCRSLDAAFCECRDAKRKIVQGIVESQDELERLAHEALGTEKAPSTLSAADFDEVARGAFVVDFISQLFGVAFGRWDIRYATGEQATPELPDPFAPLPVCPPGQLQNAQGLPARPEDVPAAYPVRIPWDGILVDDPNHPLDIERRVREVIEIIWSGKEGGPTAEAIEHEACEILGVKSLRDYFRKPSGFFADHLKRYSKSRRQAPIYWPLATSSGSYTLWICYHRLTPDTLYKCLQQFVEPKIKDVEQDIHRLRTMLTADEAGTKERKQLADAETLLNELKELHAELSLWAPKWKPNLNDGVLITACPLWKLFRLPKWRKDLEACWKELEAGDYDWSHLAYTLFPARVREKCKTDRSIAIAHGLEDLCQVQAPVPKKKTSKKSSRAAAKTPAEVEPELLA